MPSTYDQERKLEREVADAIRDRLPEVDVLALELVSPARFCVYIDRPWAGASPCARRRRSTGASDSGARSSPPTSAP
jgi:hypothetical protein